MATPSEEGLAEVSLSMEESRARTPGDAESWANRILTNVTDSTRLKSYRESTPLRPNASMIARIEEEEEPFPPAPPTKEAGSESAKADEMVPPRSASAEPVAVAAPAAVEAAAPVEPEIPSPRAKEASPDSTMAATLPLMDSLRRSAAMASADDAFSSHEKDLVMELNLWRKDPKRYAQEMESVLTVGPQFTSSGHMTLSQLLEHHGTVKAELDEQQQILNMLEEGQRKEIQSYRDQWTQEDFDRAKKKKAAPAPKAKAGSKQAQADADVDPQVAMEQERESIVQSVVSKNEDQRQVLLKKIAVLKQSVEKASHGARLMKSCFSKLQSCSQLPPLEYSRGLSLAARDVCAEDPENTQPSSHFCSRYGFLSGTAGTVVHFGKTSVRQTVMEVLLCLNDPKRKARMMLCDPNYRLVGCGWRRHSTHGAQTCFIIATTFEDLEAIASRNTCTLETIRTLLPMAKAISSKTKLVLHTNHDVQLVCPEFHPVECGNTATLSFRTGQNVSLCASLVTDRDPSPSTPQFVSGEMFVQRNLEGLVDLHVALPHAGRFHLTLFAKDDDVGGRFTPIGFVKVHTTPEWRIDKKVKFPVVTTDFHNRKCTLLSPVSGTLLPDTEYTFEIVLPRTNYLEPELRRVDDNLLVAEATVAGSQQKIDVMEREIVQASSGLDELIVRQQATTAQLLQDILVLQKEHTKKRGKDLEKNRVAIADCEEQIRAAETRVEAAKAHVASLKEKVTADRRAARQAAAQCQRCLQEKALLRKAADRSSPLAVELSLEERRAAMPPTDTQFTRYRTTATTPEMGRVSLFISGLCAVSWVIEPKP